jgi:hypothetical protein
MEVMEGEDGHVSQRARIDLTVELAIDDVEHPQHPISP